jgi:hypothetical protein
MRFDSASQEDEQDHKAVRVVEQPTTEAYLEPSQRKSFQPQFIVVIWLAAIDCGRQIC